MLKNVFASVKAFYYKASAMTLMATITMASCLVWIAADLMNGAVLVPA